MATKTFYSRVPGSTYYAADGTAYQFLGNPASLEVSDAKLIVELDSLVLSSKSVNIFSDPASAPDMTAAFDAMASAKKAAAASVAVAKSGF